MTLRINFSECFVEHGDQVICVVLGDAHGRFDTKRVAMEASFTDEDLAIFHFFHHHVLGFFYFLIN